MSTIHQNLQKLSEIKTSIRTEINAKGGSLTTSTPFSDYSAAIAMLPTGGGGEVAPLCRTAVERNISSVSKTSVTGRTTVQRVITEESDVYTPVAEP